MSSVSLSVVLLFALPFLLSLEESVLEGDRGILESALEATLRSGAVPSGALPSLLRQLAPLLLWLCLLRLHFPWIPASALRHSEGLPFPQKLWGSGTLAKVLTLH